jgi:hypothetical protein
MVQKVSLASLEPSKQADRKLGQFRQHWYKSQTDRGAPDEIISATPELAIGGVIGSRKEVYLITEQTTVLTRAARLVSCLDEGLGYHDA